MRSLLLAGLCTLALAPTASAAGFTDCGNLSATVGAIKAKNVTCKKAKAVVKAHQAGDETPKGYTGKFKYYEGGGTWTFKKGTKRVRYSIAD